ncbi:MAG: molybdopterin-synthase adenylyltransferase [Thermosediminibacterales bacterium]|nr:molybdopterin-synthase adenylyltransferase [Thermosediminibacterales bacterium]MDK2835538.1 molybdopterin-synthase adenylyltransferase [Thermosediminibacterales bacterium]
MVNLTSEQTERYSRNIIMREIGGKGQKKLLSSHVLIIPGIYGELFASSLYLAAAGIGKITVIGNESLISYLENFKNEVEDLNPDVKFNVLPETHLPNLQSKIDVVITTLPSKHEYILNNNFIRGVPIVLGSVSDGKGIMTVVSDRKRLQTYISNHTINNLFPTTAGFLGILQVVETVKIILGHKHLDEPERLEFDLLSMEFKTTRRDET